MVRRATLRRCQVRAAWVKPTNEKLRRSLMWGARSRSACCRAGTNSFWGFAAWASHVFQGRCPCHPIPAFVFYLGVAWLKPTNESLKRSEKWGGRCRSACCRAGKGRLHGSSFPTHLSFLADGSGHPRPLRMTNLLRLSKLNKHTIDLLKCGVPGPDQPAVGPELRILGALPPGHQLSIRGAAPATLTLRCFKTKGGVGETHES